jgi:MYXO-CTERM domain-containing protein
MISFKRAALVLCGGLLLGTAMQANVVPPGGTMTPDNLNGFAALLGPALAPVLVSPAVSTTFSGTVYSDVYTDPFTHDLDFVYQYQAGTTPPQQGIERITAASFSPAVTDGTFADAFAAGGPGIDLGYDAISPLLGFTAATSLNPNGVTRSGDGTVVGFNFSGAGSINAGQESPLLIVRTFATQFTIGQGGVIDSQTANMNVYAPTPEPRMAGLAAFALLGLVAVFFRRRKAQVTE